MARSATMSVLHNVDEAYAAELKKEIMDAVGDLSDIEVWGEEVLVAPFIHPTKSKGGIIIAGQGQNDAFDGRCRPRRS